MTPEPTPDFRFTELSPNEKVRSTRLALLKRALQKARLATNQWQRISLYEQAFTDVLLNAVMDRTERALKDAEAYLGEVQPA